MATEEPTTVEELEARNAELERERELLNAIANHAPSLLCLVGADGRVRPAATNIAFESRLGYTPDETGGEFFWRRYVPPGDADEVRERIEQAMRGEPVEPQDGRWVTRTVSSSTSPGRARSSRGSRAAPST